MYRSSCPASAYCWRTSPSRSCPWPFTAPIEPIHRDYLPRPGRVRLVFGEALHPADLEREGEGEDARHRITSALHDRVIALFDSTRAAA